MRLFSTLLVLFLAVLLAESQASRDSTSANEGKRSGGILRVLRTDSITVPDGATLPLVLETAIWSATSRSGDLAVARLAEDVRVGEKVVVQAGTEVRGLVTAAVASGRVKGRAQLAFDFDTLFLRGKEHSIGTRSVDLTAANSHERDAVIIGSNSGSKETVEIDEKR